MKLRTGDTVLVTIGKDKGKTSKVTKTMPKVGKIVVEGINKYKRHLKRQSDQNPGGIVEIERAMDIAKVQVICDSCQKPTRIGYETKKTGEKIRICKKCHAPITKEIKKTK